MKKGLLLGLLVLSSMAMAAESTTTTINVNTKLNIDDTGIIITPDPDGDVEGNSVELNHGTPDRKGDSIATGKSVYIKTAEGQLPAGRKLKLDLNSSATDKNNLVTGGKSSAETIPHTLTGKIKNGKVIDNGDLTVAGETLNSTGTVETTGAALEVAFTSTVQQNDLFGKFTGNYANTSTLSVTVLAN